MRVGESSAPGPTTAPVNVTSLVANYQALFGLEWDLLAVQESRLVPGQELDDLEREVRRRKWPLIGGLVTPEGHCLVALVLRRGGFQEARTPGWGTNQIACRCLVL